MMELMKNRADDLAVVLDAERSQEETMEAIVPDACPDIGQILDVDGQICLTEKDVQDGGVTLAGHVNAQVTYRPEEGGELRRIEVKLPFRMQVDGGDVGAQDDCVVLPALRAAEARALNPRKVLLRVDLCARVQVFRARQTEYCTGLTAPDDAGVQQLRASQSVYRTVSVKEKEFTFSDDVELKDGPDGPATILSGCSRIGRIESKIIGSKLIFKGEIVLTTRYLVGEELCSARNVMPFSQIMEVADAGEEDDSDVTAYVIASDDSQLGENGRTISLTLQVMAQAVIGRTEELELLQDAYGTACRFSVAQDTLTLPRLAERGTRVQSVRETLPTDRPVRNVVDATAAVCSAGQSREDGQIVLTAQVRVNVLYCDEQGEYRCLRRSVSAVSRLDAPAPCVCRCVCACPGPVSATPVADGIEVRFDVEFRCLVTEQVTLPSVVDVREETAPAAEEGRRPSVVLRMAERGQRLWDVAKAYSTTMERIMQANQLEDEILPAERMLLIPNAR